MSFSVDEMWVMRNRRVSVPDLHKSSFNVVFIYRPWRGKNGSDSYS